MMTSATQSTHMGPLEPLLADASVTAIHMEGDGVRFERDGETHTSPHTFTDDAQRQQIIERIVALGGGRLSAEHPVADVTLSDGTLIHATWEPLSLSMHKGV